MQAWNLDPDHIYFSMFLHVMYYIFMVPQYVEVTENKSSV